MTPCNACRGPYHPATGHRLMVSPDSPVLCGPCTRLFIKWISGHTKRQWGGVSFYDHAATSIVARDVGPGDIVQLTKYICQYGNGMAPKSGTVLKKRVSVDKSGIIDVQYEIRWTDGETSGAHASNVERVPG